VSLTVSVIAMAVLVIGAGIALYAGFLIGKMQNKEHFEASLRAG
jgi:hypothetical protein